MTLISHINGKYNKLNKLLFLIFIKFYIKRFCVPNKANIAPKVIPQIRQKLTHEPDFPIKF